ncbi:MAG TPA: hypothetical protein VHU44_05880 [Acidobacteriaceae bacterium]|nr:hypothetical protein [Acidobacteriaceae bacterium]
MIHLRPEALKESKPHEYVMRFVFGGLCTAGAGLIAKRFGPGIGGLFLAFPAIFPASASLIEAHEKRRKQDAGMHGGIRGRHAAAVDAAGSALGAVGLAAFAAVVWLTLEGWSAVGVIAAATVVWVAVSVGAWWLRRATIHHWARRHKEPSHAGGGVAMKRS